MSEDHIGKLNPYSTQVISVSSGRLKTGQISENFPDTVGKTASLGEARELIFIVRGLFERFMLYEHKDIKLGRFNPLQRHANELDLTPYEAVDRGVTRFHARIHVENNQLFITDMESTNGTYIRGIKAIANHPTLLHKGDEVMLGQLPIQIMYR